MFKASLGHTLSSEQILYQNRLRNEGVVHETDHTFKKWRDMYVGVKTEKFILGSPKPLVKRPSRLEFDFPWLH